MLTRQDHVEPENDLHDPLNVRQDMNTLEATEFIGQYGPASREQVCFAWNQHHGQEFLDANDKRRQVIIAGALAAPCQASLELIADLFEAEARWSKEAWCVRDTFSKLGTILLTRGGTAALDLFLRWFAVSFDSHSECHAMTLDPITLQPLIAEVDRRLLATTDAGKKAGLEMARDLFAKHKSGNPMKGMVKLDPRELGPARVVSRAEVWFDRLKGMFRTRR